MVALDPLNRRATRRTFIFACFEGRAAGGYAEGERIRDARKVKGAGGRERGPRRGPRNNAAYGACSSPANTRCSSAAGCIINRFSHEAAAHRALPGCSLPSPFPSCLLFFPFSHVARFRSKMSPSPDSFFPQFLLFLLRLSYSTSFSFPPPPPPPSNYEARIFGN